MHVLITGGTGFIGHKLCRSLLADGHQCTVLSRQPTSKVVKRCGKVAAINRLNELSPATSIDAIVNLAGEGIADKRWSPARKQVLRNSRIETTDELIKLIRRLDKKPSVLLSGSAVGFYGNQESHTVTEETPPRADFAQKLCEDWETSALEARSEGVRVCLLRTGLVLGKAEGFLKRMLPPFKLGLGGRLGDGSQWMPWIHIDDHIAIMRWLLEHPTLEGPFNLTAPHPETNKDFSRELGRQLSRPTIMPVPAFVLKTALGEMSELLLGGQRALPARLEKSGFEFRYRQLDEALSAVLRA